MHFIAAQGLLVKQSHTYCALTQSNPLRSTNWIVFFMTNTKIKTHHKMKIYNRDLPQSLPFHTSDGVLSER